MIEEMSSRFCKQCKCIMPLTDGRCDHYNHPQLQVNSEVKKA